MSLMIATSPAVSPPVLPGARDARDPARALKRGPSRLPREQVAATQRDRLYDGLVRTVAELGYANATVSDICRASGVTRPAFYEHFISKEGAFLDAYRHGTAVLFRMMEEAYISQDRPDRAWSDAGSAALKVLLEVLAGVPAFATVAFVEIESVGPGAREERAALLDRFAAFFRPAPSTPAGVDRAELIATVVGGVYATLHRHVGAGRFAELPSLLPSLVYFVVAPFAGPAEALRAQRCADGSAGPRAIAPCAPEFRAPTLPGTDRFAAY
jgi:AcrR family transcriptional regulator